jgi:hypothetical protein
MAIKTDFSAEEWKKLLESPLLAGIEIDLAEVLPVVTAVGAVKDQDLVGVTRTRLKACDVEVPIRTKNQAFGPAEVTPADIVTHENIFKTQIPITVACGRICFCLAHVASDGARRSDRRFATNNHPRCNLSRL